ncbi:MAG: hypothetical protein IJQ12_05385 [Lachnospiraceae bacterium]|nr:hypothetical protein [Lachnospiraceae bacterium]
MKSSAKNAFTGNGILKTVLALAIPTVIGQIILVIYNIADTFFVSLTGSDAKISAVTVCLPAFMFLSAISNLFGIGASSAMARALGKGKLRRAKRASSFAFWGCLVLTLLYSLSVLGFLHPYVRLLGGIDEEAHLYASSYMLVTVVAGGVFASMSALLSHLFRAEGRSLVSSIGVSLGGFFNIALDPLFMFVILPEGKEVLGAGIATALSNLCAFVFFLIALKRRGKKKTVLRLSVSVKRLKKTFEKKIPADILRAGLPACLMTLFENVSYAVLGSLCAHHSLEAHAGIGVAKKINMLAHCIVRGMAQGVLPFISFNYAAGKWKRMRRGIFTALAVSVSLAALCMGACLLFPDALVRLFIREQTASRMYGTSFLRILCIGAPFSACAYMLISFFQATGKGVHSFMLAVLRKGALDIPLMFLLGAAGGIFRVVWATPLADIFCCLVAVILLVLFLKKKEVHA